MLLSPKLNEALMDTLIHIIFFYIMNINNFQADLIYISNKMEPLAVECPSGALIVSLFS